MLPLSDCHHARDVAMLDGFAAATVSVARFRYAVATTGEMAAEDHSGIPPLELLGAYDGLALVSVGAGVALSGRKD